MNAKIFRFLKSRCWHKFFTTPFSFNLSVKFRPLTGLVIAESLAVSSMSEALYC